MEHIDKATEIPSTLADFRCRVGESEAKEGKQTQVEEKVETERSLITSAVRNLPEFDVQIARQHPLRILLAEDSMVNMKIALWFLKKLGYHADVAFNGLEVIDALKRRSYDVILMDAEMPEMDGRQATVAIRKDFPVDQQPFIIAMTANTTQGVREEYLSIGMDDYITKPIKIEEMIRALLASRPLGDMIERALTNNDNLQIIRKVA